jgi:acetyl esterase/lipase
MFKTSAMLFGLLMCSTLQAQQVVRLYPGKAPGSEKWNWTEGENNENPTHMKMAYNVVDPTLTVFLPDAARANGTAVVICPGGGFLFLAMAHEGYDVAKWLTDHGVAAFVLKYRLERSNTNDPVSELGPKLGDLKKFDAEVDTVVTMAIADGRNAVAFVREHAAAYKVDPKKIGIMGFSAGATTTLGVAFSYDAKSRPDFIAPIYPYLDALQDQTVRADAPPMFVCAASDDGLGLATHSTRIYEAWLAAKRSAELHIYLKGGHGFGMQKNNLPTDHWIERFGDWLEVTGFLPKK